MIFEKDHITFHLLDVFTVKQNNIKIVNYGRNFDALSFRMHAQTRILQGNHEVELSDHSICYFPAGVDYTRISQCEDLIVIHFNSFGYTSDHIEFFYPERAAMFQSYFEKILLLWRKKEIGYRHACTALLHEIFAECCKEVRQETAPDSKINTAVKYLSEHFADPQLTVQAAAQQAHMSEVYFRKLFKQAFGLSPRKHIIYLRMKHAAALIETGYYSLTEISEMCGFHDYKYFSTEFKRTFGVSPSNYSYDFSEIIRQHTRIG